MEALVFLHVEAASDSEPTFPIEVYCSSGDGGGAGWLVNPAGIERWRNWPMPFLQDHRITPHDLTTYGSAPETVCRELAARARDLTLHTLEPDRHQVLLRELYLAALGVESPIKIADARSAFLSILGRAENTQTNPDALLVEALEQASKSRHAIRGGAFEIPFLHEVEAQCVAIAGA
jgi:hypothetical protein